MKEILVLKEWEEYVGTLRNIEKNEEMILLEFDECYVRIYGEINMGQYIGKKIGVLRTDIEGREVLVREIKLKGVTL